METVPNFVSMAKSPEEMKPDMPAMDDAQPIYPYGLALCLNQEELDKLDLDSGCEVGDMMHFEALAKVTSITKNDTTDGPKTRVELQIVGIALGDDHDEDDDAPSKVSPDKMYKAD